MILMRGDFNKQLQVPATHVLCKAIVVAAQTENEVAGLPDVDPITDMLE